MGLTVKELADQIGAEVQGDGDRLIESCATLGEAGGNDVSFLANPRYLRAIKNTRAGAVILSKEDAKEVREVTLLIADDPYFAFREAVIALHGFRRQPEPGISELAYVHPDAKIGQDCVIEPFAFVSAGAVIGDRCVLHPHCFIGPEARVGDDCIFYPNVSVYDFCVIGNRVILQAGSVVGSDGFGFATHKLPNQQEPAHHKIPQVGNVEIADDVELGSNCSIQRATVGSTYIGLGTKFADLIAVGHGVQVGEHNLVVSQCGIAGSTTTGKYVTMGGQVGIAGHLKIGDVVQIAAKSGVNKDLVGGQNYGGVPALPIAAWRRVMTHVSRLSVMADQLRAARKQIKKMEARLDEMEGANASSASASDQNTDD